MNIDNIIGNIMMFDESMHLLPPEITKCIYDYIPSLTRTVLNKSLYMSNRKCIRQNIPVLKYEGYMRHIVRKDNNFVFNNLLNDNFTRWQHMKNFKYKNFTFDDYIAYIIYLSQEHDASKVHALILDKQNLDGKKRHKNARIRSNTWSN